MTRRFFSAVAHLRRPLLSLLVSAAVCGHRVEAQDDRAAVLATVDRMLDGMRTKDSVLMQSAFLPGARLLGMRPAAGGAQRVQELTAEAFVAFMMRDKRPAWTERLFDPEIRIEGTLASVWGAYDFHFDTTFSHCGVDAIHLLKTSAGWRISGIADTYQTSGCAPRPAPRPSQARPTWGDDLLASIAEGPEKRRFILDCTGCHRMDRARAFPAGQPRDAASWKTVIDRMLGFAGATTGFPVIAASRQSGATAAWLEKAWNDASAVAPYRAAPSARWGEASIRTFLLDEAADLPHDIAVDSGGRVVVTGMMTHQMLVLDTATGAWRSVPIPVPQANPRALDVDAAGRWWVALGKPQKVARFDPRRGDGSWLVVDAGVYAHSVGLGPDGAAWLNGHFTRDPEVIARVDTLSKTVVRVALPSHPELATVPGGPIPYELRVATDGTVWTSELQGNRLVGYHPVTKRTQIIEMPERDMGPRRFDIAADGSLWVPAYAANELVHIIPQSNGPATIERVPMPVSNSLPYVVRLDPVRGGMWIGTGAGDVVMHYAPNTREFTTYALPEPGAIIRHLTIAPRTGDVWLAYGASPGTAARVARLQPAAAKP